MIITRVCVVFEFFHYLNVDGESNTWRQPYALWTFFCNRLLYRLFYMDAVKSKENLLTYGFGIYYPPKGRGNILKGNISQHNIIGIFWDFILSYILSLLVYWLVCCEYTTSHSVTAVIPRILDLTWASYQAISVGGFIGWYIFVLNGYHATERR